MKCPKCGYISFDYNQICPKCNKEISSQQAMMNLQSFKPEPPFLLGGLIGDTDISGIHLQSEGPPAAMGEAMEMDMDLEELTDIETGEIGPDEAEELEIGPETEDSGETEIQDLEQVVDGDEIHAPPGKGEEEITLDLDEMFLEEPDVEVSIPEEATRDEIESEITLDGISLEDSGLSEDITIEETKDEPKESPIDTTPLDLELDGDIKGSEPMEIDLNLDDLKMDDIGKTEIDASLEPPENGTGLLEDISLDEPATEKEGATIELGDFTFDDSGDKTDGVLDLGDILLDQPIQEESGEALELGEISPEGPSEQDQDIEAFLELGDVSLDETEKEDSGETPKKDDTPLISDQDLEALISDEGPEPIALDHSKERKDDKKAEDDLMLELENLDIDIDLDGPEDK